MKWNLSRRITAGTISTAVLVALFGGIAAPPAAAATPPSTYSAPAAADPASLGVTSSVTGVLGGLLGPILNPVLGQVVDPLLSGLTALPAAILNPLLVSLIGGGHEAITPGATIDPSESVLSTGTPVTCPAATTTCYKQAGAAVNAPGVLTLGAALIQGTTQRVAVSGGDRLIAKSQVAGLNIGGLLGLIDVVKAGVVQATSQCSGTVASVIPSGTASTATVEVLGTKNGTPVVGLEVSNSGGVSALTAKVLGITLPVGGTTTVTLTNGLTAKVVLNGNLLNLAVDISLSQLLAGLGLGAVGALISNLADLKATVNIAVGAGVTSTATSTQSVGLAVQIGLALDINLNLLDIVGARVVTSGDPTKNLLNLKLAYTNCSATGGSLTPSTWILPGLT